MVVSSVKAYHPYVVLPLLQLPGKNGMGEIGEDCKTLLDRIHSIAILSHAKNQE